MALSHRSDAAQQFGAAALSHEIVRNLVNQPFARSVRRAVNVDAAHSRQTGIELHADVKFFCLSVFQQHEIYRLERVQ